VKMVSARPVEWMPLVLVAFGVLAGPPVLAGYYTTPRPGNLALADREFREDVQYLRGRPGPALCLDLLLCYSAGKPLEFEPFFDRELMGTGRLDPRVIAAELDGRKYSVIQADESASYFAPNLITVFKARYRPDRRNGARVFWVPVP